MSTPDNSSPEHHAPPPDFRALLRASLGAPQSPQGSSHLGARRALDQMLAHMANRIGPPEAPPDPEAAQRLCSDHLRMLEALVSAQEKGEACPLEVPPWLVTAWHAAKTQLTAWYEERGFTGIVLGGSDPGDPSPGSNGGKIETPRCAPQEGNPLSELHEWLKCWADAVYFVDNYCHLRHPSRGTIPFRLWDWQAYVLTQWHHNKLNILLKARQEGASEMGAAYALWLCLFHDTKVALFISKDEVAARVLLDKAGTMYGHLPDFLRPGARDEKGNPLGPYASVLMATNMSTLTVAHFGLDGRARPSVIRSLPATGSTGRSMTASVVILDEWAHQQWQDAIWSAVEPTADAGGKIIGISTANGLGNLYYAVWVKAEENKNGFKAIFLSWRRHPERDQAWYEQKKSTYEEANKLALFHQEYPDQPGEAFIQSGNPYFNISYLKLHRARIAEEKPPLVEPVDGLTIWEEPVPGHRYILAADVALGTSDGDFDAAVVYERETMREVACFHGRVPPEVYARKLYDLGMKYNKALLAVERNNHGLAILLLLSHKKRYIAAVNPETGEEGALQAPEEALGYPNLYHHEEVLHPNRAPDARPGWPTNIFTKPMMCDALAKGLRAELIQPRDLRFINEATIFAYDEKGGMGAPAGHHDDLVICHAIAAFLLTRPDRKHNVLEFMQRREELANKRVREAQARTASKSGAAPGTVSNLPAKHAVTGDVATVSGPVVEAEA